MLRRAALQQKLNAIWYQGQSSLLNNILLPCSFLYKTAIRLKKIFVHPTTQKNPVPVIVVGNITVGGSGKTPAIIALVQMLQQQGRAPGVISRGYPINPTKPICVTSASKAYEVGDEALLIFKRTQVPVCVCRNRQAAIQMLATQGIDIILSDDGLQNFSFKHDLEIVLYDKIAQFGNQKLLPAGPLREPLSRLNQVDFLVEKQLATDSDALPSWQSTQTVYSFTLHSTGFVRLKANTAILTADYFQNKKVIAITAIAHPEGFFASLSAQGIHYTPIIFPDHYLFQAKDFAAYHNCEIIMTEKDAVKCFDFCSERFWTMPLAGNFTTEFQQAFFTRLSCI